MKIRSILPLVYLTIIGLAPAGNELLAQSSGIDFSYGRWWREGGSSETYSASLYRPWFGPFTYGLGLTVLNDRGNLDDRSHTGGEVTVSIGRGRGIYAIGAAGLGMRHQGGSLDAVWSTGGGYAWQPLSFVSLGAEARYQVEKNQWVSRF